MTEVPTMSLFYVPCTLFLRALSTGLKYFKDGFAVYQNFQFPKDY